MKRKWICMLAACILAAMQTVCLAGREISDSPLYDGLRFVRENGKCGYIDMAGNIVIPVEYDALSYFCDGVAVIAKNGKYGYVDNRGDILVPLEYDETLEFKPQSNGLAPVKKDGRWGYMKNPGQTRNADGTPVIHWIDGADRLDDFYNGYAMVVRSNTFSVIDVQFEEVFGGSYDWIEQTQYDNTFIVSQYGKKGVFRYDGTPILPLEYDEIYTEQMEPGVRRFRVVKDGKCGLIDLDGNTALACIFDDIRISPDAEDIIIAAWNGCYGIINSAGKEYVPFIYEDIWKDGNCYQIKLAGKYGLLNQDFSQLLPPVYDELGGVYQQGGLQMVRKDGLCGYVDANGVIVIPPQFEEAEMFRGGIAVVKQNGKYGCINQRGQFVIPLEYNRIERPVSGEAYMEKGGVKTPFHNPMVLEYDTPQAPFMILQIDNSDMYTGEYIPLDAGPVLIENKAFLPVRALVEQMGGKAQWDAETQIAEFTYGEKTVSLQIGSAAAMVDGAEKPLEQPPEIRNGRIMLPLRFVMEEFGAKVIWEEATQKIIITY